ncbi:MAG TPA: MarR family transcriptional regulator [Gemmatimonadaceae bacterium]|jgi:DNA-binding MarR family transcriptional regulator|nr:MarR family transcriptional regulator [Gemmatimonadaceae bacterium]
MASRRRSVLLERLAQVGRANSDATVLFHATVAKLLGLHPSDEKTMSVLQRLGPQTAGEIARHTGLATASVTDLLDRLERRGWVRRVADPRDRRRVVVEPVARRVADAARLFASTAKSVARMYERYNDAELEVIADFLERNGERLRAETSKLER